MLQQILPIFYDSGSSGDIDIAYLISAVILIELILLVWFAINFFRTCNQLDRKVYPIIERLFCVDGDFPNIPTLWLMIVNGILLFGILVHLIAKIIS